MKAIKPNFSSEITLIEAPLLEAWVEIRWKLTPTEQGLFNDPGYPIAPGIFYSSVKDKYNRMEPLDASEAPINFLPHVVRHQFRPAEGSSHLLQLGPGVASANFLTDYSWDDFKQICLYLRKNLTQAYEDYPIEAENVILRYRNAFDFEYSSGNLLDFLSNTLNTTVQLPEYIPGVFGSKSFPTGTGINFTFDLKYPKSTGTLKFNTGNRIIKDADDNVVDTIETTVVQFEVSSGGEDVPNIANEDNYSSWLDMAHSVIHEWFFSIVEGELLKSIEAKIK